MDFGVSALITLNNMLFAFLIWVLLRFAVVLAVALGQAAFSAFLLLCMPSRGIGCFCLLRRAATWRRFLSGGGLYCLS
jgi:hypothetical protein